MINEQLLREVVAKIREQAAVGGWDQGYYINECGTSFCMAGWTLRLSGYGILKDHRDLWVWVSPEGTTHPESRAHGIAQDLLGLDDDTADSLFFCVKDNVTDFVCTVEHVTDVQGL